MSDSNSNFFDLHTQGLGYLNRVRHVQPRRGQGFWACDIAALSGPTDDANTTRFDCRVSGAEAITLVQKCQQAVDDNRKVLIGFRLGDLWIDTFVYKHGDRAGETGVALKARLLYIGWIKIDGEWVYTADSNANPADAESSQDETDDEAELAQA